MKATELLKRQHREAEGMFKAALSGSCDGRQAKEELVKHLLSHMLAEQVVLFPEISALEPELVREACEEHAVARFELRRVAETAPEDPGFRAKLTMLAALIERHAKEEEDALLPRIEAALTDELNERLGQQMEELFDALVAHSRKQDGARLAAPRNAAV